MEDISIVVTILTAMITPAVLIVACGSLSLTTSQRLNRSIDRTRKVSIELKEIQQGKKEVSPQEMNMLYGQLEISAKRAMLLQTAMTLLYLAIGFFIATSLLIGIFEIFGWMESWVLILLSIIGAMTLLGASIFLLIETRLALRAVEEEMKFRISFHKE